MTSFTVAQHRMATTQAAMSLQTVSRHHRLQTLARSSGPGLRPFSSAWIHCRRQQGGPVVVRAEGSQKQEEATTPQQPVRPTLDSASSVYCSYHQFHNQQLDPGRTHTQEPQCQQDSDCRRRPAAPAQKTSQSGSGGSESGSCRPKREGRTCLLGSTSCFQPSWLSQR